MFSLGKADFKTAIEPATCGVAWLVPVMVIPAATIFTPGAAILRSLDVQLKQVILSAAETSFVLQPQSTVPMLLS